MPIEPNYPLLKEVDDLMERVRELDPEIERVCLKDPAMECKCGCNKWIGQHCAKCGAHWKGD